MFANIPFYMLRRKQTSLEPYGLLYSRPFSFSDVGRIGNEALAAGAKELRASLFVTPETFSTLVPRSLAVGPIELSRIHASRSCVAAHLAGVFGNEMVEGSFVAVQNQEYPLVWLVLTDATSDFFRKPFRRFLGELYPRPVPPILTSPQLRQLLVQLERHPQVRSLRIAQLGARGRIRSEGARKHIERDRRWTDLGLEEAFESVLAEGQWVTDATAAYEYSDGARGRFTISRAGSFRFEKQVAVPAAAVLSDSAQFATEWYEFLQNRQRRRETHFRSQPFQIAFNFPAVGSSDQVGDLIEALRTIPSSTFTVLHSNPFFHGVVVDWHDGSTNEVLVLDDSSVMILPQGRSTVRSLRSICSHVFSSFREGKLEDVTVG